MNTQLKKGDKCNSPLGVVTIKENQSSSEQIIIMTNRGLFAILELTCIPSHAERMQAMLDIAWDAENRLEDDETVQLKVGAFVEFARHYCAIADQLDECIQCFKLNAKTHLTFAKETEKILKEEDS
jgi:hypothetical protein